jgi:hypothetical protein
VFLREEPGQGRIGHEVGQGDHGWDANLNRGP